MELMSVLTLLLAFLRKSWKACFYPISDVLNSKKVFSKLNFEVVKNQNARRYILLYSIIQSHKILHGNCCGIFFDTRTF